MSVIKYDVVSLSKHTCWWSESFSPGSWEPSKGLEPLQGHRERWRRRIVPQHGRSAGGSSPESSPRSRAVGQPGCWGFGPRLTRCFPSTPDEEPAIGRRWRKEAGGGGRTEGGEMCCLRTRKKKKILCVFVWVSEFLSGSYNPFLSSQSKRRCCFYGNNRLYHFITYGYALLSYPGFITEL